MRSVVVEQAIHAPLERIWRACSSASGLRAWLADDVAGDIAPGAQLVLSWSALGVAIPLRVEIAELAGPSARLALGAEDSQLLIEAAEGHVTLTHRADFDDDERAGTLSSWRLSLGTLAHYLEQHDAEPRSVHWAVARAKASIEDAHAFFTLPGAQSGWLTRTGSGTGIGEVGSEVALDLAWGSRLTGRVLSHTSPRDVLFSWRESNESLLALRTLPSPDTAGERLLIATWSSWGPKQPEIIAQNLNAALARLSRILERRATA